LNLLKFCIRNSNSWIILCVFQAQNLAASYEKKQKKIDQEIAQWKAKVDEVQAELEASQRELRTNSTEVRLLVSI
jgi:myosin protein heavy chain/myosin heavy chain 6/7